MWFKGRATRLLIGAVCALLPACSNTSVPPTYTQTELKAICERRGGIWHPDDLVGGFCEYRRADLPARPSS